MGWDTGLVGLKKYRELGLILVFIALLATALERLRVLHALSAGLGLALIASYAQAAGLLPLYKGQAVPSSSITHGTLMAWVSGWNFGANHRHHSEIPHAWPRHGQLWPPT